MSKALFKDHGRSMGPYRCCSLRSIDCDGQANLEHCLAGAKGEIWEAGVGKYKAIVAYAEHEKIISFNSSKLAAVVLRLQVPASPTEQAVWANNPNRRFK